MDDTATQVVQFEADNTATLAMGDVQFRLGRLEERYGKRQLTADNLQRFDLPFAVGRGVRLVYGSNKPTRIGFHADRALLTSTETTLQAQISMSDTGGFVITDYHDESGYTSVGIDASNSRVTLDGDGDVKLKLKNLSSTSSPCLTGDIIVKGGSLFVCSATDTWTQTGGSGGVAGADTQVQFNDGGSLAGDASFTWAKTLRKLTIGDEGSTGTIQGPDAAEEGNDGGDIQIFGGTAADYGNGGNVEILAGYGGAANGANGGQVSVNGGSAQSNNADGGDVVLAAGARDGTGRSGKVSIGLSGSSMPNDTKKGSVCFYGEGLSSFRHLFYAQKNTTDATPTVLCDIGLSAFLGGSTLNSALVEARVIGRRTGGTSGTADDFATYHLVQAIKYTTSTGAYSLAGSVVVVQSYEDQAGWGASIAIASTTTLQVQVGGAAGNNITWRCEVAVFR